MPDNTVSPGGLARPEPAPRRADRWVIGLRQRLRRVAGDRSYRQIGSATNTHPETVRRYLTGGLPCVRFITAFCEAYGINANWLLFGEEPMTRAPRGMALRVTVDLAVDASGAGVVSSASCAVPEVATPALPAPPVDARDAGRQERDAIGKRD